MRRSRWLVGVLLVFLTASAAGCGSAYVYADASETSPAPSVGDAVTMAKHFVCCATSAQGGEAFSLDGEDLGRPCAPQIGHLGPGVLQDANFLSAEDICPPRPAGAGPAYR